MSRIRPTVETLLAAAAELSDPSKRASYLDQACAGDIALRREVESLLAAHDEAGAFLQEPAQAGNHNALAEKEGDRIGRYKLLEQIGQGGMGTVWMAEQTEPVRRRVALKVIKQGMDSRQILARFEAERQALALMDHPNIAKVLDAGATSGGRPYFVMELVKGVPLTKFCDEQRLSIRERLELFVPVCQAIQHAHQKGIIHRDISPGNVLVALYDGRPVPKVIDFGIAKAIGQPLTERTLVTEFGAIMGKLEYMSPEQAEFNQLDIDTRSDIYSLGVLLYELLTGTTPLTSEALRQAAFDEVLRRVRHLEPSKPSTRLSETKDRLASISAQRKLDPAHLRELLRGDLDCIVMKALEKERNRRYETATGIGTDVLRFLANEPVAARAPGNLYRFQKLVRRNKLAFAASGAVAATLVVGMTVSIWQAARATKAEGIAIEKATVAQVERERADQQRTNAVRNLYVANMALLQQAWEQNQVARVVQLIEETAAYPQRGFEWYYWQRQTHLELRTLRGHLGSVPAVAFSPDGRRIVTGGDNDQTAKVWEAASGKQLLTIKGHSKAITFVAFSRDGQRIFTASEDETVRIWEAASGKQLLTIKAHSNDSTFVAFSPDGQRIVTGSEDKTATIWETANGKELATLKGHSDDITSVAFSPDGQRIATGGEGETARVWEAASGKQLFVLKGHGARINSVGFSPDSQRIVTGSADKTVKVWETASGKEVLTLIGHRDAISSVAFSPDGQRIVAGGFDATAKVWETASGKELFTLTGHGGIFEWFSPDGQRIVTITDDNTAKLWDAASGKELLTLKGHSRLISSVAFSPDGQRIVTGSWDQTAKVWDAASAREPLSLDMGFSGRTVTFFPDSQRILTGGGGNGVVSVWEAGSGKNLFSLHLQSTGRSTVALSPDGQRIITGSEDQTAKVWDAASGKELLALKGHTNVTAVGFSPDGQRIVTASWDRPVKVWDVASGKELLTLEGHRDRIVSVVFDPGGQRILTFSHEGTAIRVWEGTSGKELFALKGHSNITAVSFSPDGQRIVTVGSDRLARVWDAASGKELLTLKGHRDWILSVALAPEGQRIVTGSRDATAKVWDAATGKELLTLKGHYREISSVAFSPDGQRIVTGSEDKTAKVWDVATGRELLTLKGHSSLIDSVAFSPDGLRIVTGSSYDHAAKVWKAATPEHVVGWQKEEQAAAE